MVEFKSVSPVPNIQCPICWGEFTGHDTQIWLPCCHGPFHNSCIKKSFDIAMACPICRTKFPELVMLRSSSGYHGDGSAGDGPGDGANSSGSGSGGHGGPASGTHGAGGHSNEHGSGNGSDSGGGASGPVDLTDGPTADSIPWVLADVSGEESNDSIPLVEPAPEPAVADVVMEPAATMVDALPVMPKMGVSDLSAASVTSPANISCVTIGKAIPKMRVKGKQPLP